MVGESIAALVTSELTECPLWVKSRHMHCKKACPLYPQERTCAVQLGTSAMSQ